LAFLCVSQNLHFEVKYQQRKIGSVKNLEIAVIKDAHQY